MSKKNDLMELLLYLVVGGCATLSEWVLFYVFDKVLPHYMLSTVLAYILCLASLLQFAGVCPLCNRHLYSYFLFF